MTVKVRRGKEEAVDAHLRDTFEAQLPIVAAILLMSYEGDVDEEDFHAAARDAISLCVALEEELS